MTKCSKKCLITPGFELKGVLKEKCDYYAICDNCDCGFGYTCYNYCPCCGKLLKNTLRNLQKTKKCYGTVCKYYHGDYTVMVARTNKKDKENGIFWNQCLTCKESYQIFFVFCPCCGEELLPQFEQGNISDEMKALRPKN